MEAGGLMVVMLDRTEERLILMPSIYLMVFQSHPVSHFTIEIPGLKSNACQEKLKHSHPKANPKLP